MSALLTCACDLHGVAQLGPPFIPECTAVVEAPVVPGHFTQLKRVCVGGDICVHGLQGHPILEQLESLGLPLCAAGQHKLGPGLLWGG